MVPVAGGPRTRGRQEGWRTSLRRTREREPRKEVRKEQVQAEMLT